MKPFSILFASTLVFLVGTLAGIAFTTLQLPGATLVERPATTAFLTDQPSPHDYLKESNIKVYDDKVEFSFPGRTLSWARYEDSNSMDPVFDKSANGVAFVPRSSADIHEGDIITYKQGKNLIVHRVVQAGFDPDGWYAITKGDNNPIADLGKVRFSQVQHVLLAILY